MSNEENRPKPKSVLVNESSTNRPECSPSALPTPTTLTTPSVVRGPELIDDVNEEPPDNTIPQLAALLETTKGTPSQGNGDHSRRPDGIEEIDDEEEPVSERTVAESFDDSTISKKLEQSNVNTSQGNGDHSRRPAGVEEIDDEEEPVSERTVAESFDDSAISKKLEQSNVNSIYINEVQDNGNDEDSCSTTPFQVAYYQDEESAITQQPRADNSNIANESPHKDETEETSPSSNVMGNTADTETESYDDTPTVDADNPTSVLHIPEAFLVEQQDDLTVYDAVQVDEPWWKRHKAISGSLACLSLSSVVAAIVGTALASDQDRAHEALQTLAPTLSPPPVNCSVSDFEPVYVNDCDWCQHAVGRDGELLITYRDMDEEAKSLGLFELSSQYLSLEYVEEFTFSGDSFYASDPYFGDDTTGAVWHVPNLAQDTTTIVPAHDDVDSFGAFGTSIAVDGDILVIGAPNDNDSVGSAFIYRRQGNNLTSWYKEAKLVPPPSNDSSAQSFGGSVLVRDNTVIVSADHHGSDNSGAVFFYEFDTSSESWQKNSTLVNTECDGRFGASLALTGNGGLLVGCPFDDDAAGSVYYYQQSNGDKNYTLQQKIIAPDRQALDKFGGNNHHLAVSPNGDLVAIGTFEKASGLNEKVYIFGRFDNVWKRVDQVDAPDDSFYFGHDVAINSDSLIVASWKNTYFYQLTCVEEGLEGEAAEDVPEGIIPI